MLTLKTTGRFQKDYKKAIKSGRDIARLKQVMTWIAQEQDLPPALRDHKLIGNYQGRRECHLAGDWLLIAVPTASPSFFSLCFHSISVEAI